MAQPKGKNGLKQRSRLLDIQYSHVLGINARIYRLIDTDEYVIKFYRNGLHMKKSDYFTNDKSDAINTAIEVLKYVKDPRQNEGSQQS